MATKKFNIGDKVRRINHHNNCEDSKFEVGQVGTVFKIRDETFVDVKVNGYVNEWNDVANLELVDTETFKFKIGDRVKVVKPALPFKRQYLGAEFTIKSYNPNGKKTFNEPHYGMDGGTCWVWQESELELATNEKIVITHDGKTTTATLYRNDGSKVTATSRCAPEDTFDFNVGAKLAMERLTEKTNHDNCEWRVVHRPAKKGDYVRIVKPCFSFTQKGDILKVCDTAGSGIYVLGKDHPRKTDNDNYRWCYCREHYEVVEKVTADEPKKPEPPTPKYWTGRAVCVDNCKGDTDFIVGKIYKIDDGKFIDEKGDVRPFTNDRVVNPEDLTKGKYWKEWPVKFIPIVEENKPLTTEELRKMDGQKVWLLSLDHNKKPYPDNYLGGWHTVNARIDKLEDETGSSYKITDNDTHYGFHAYRQAPSK